MEIHNELIESLHFQTFNNMQKQGLPAERDHHFRNIRDKVLQAGPQTRPKDNCFHDITIQLSVILVKLHGQVKPTGNISLWLRKLLTYGHNGLTINRGW